MLRSDAEHRVSKHPPARAARSRAGLERPSTGSGRGQRKTLAVWTEKGAYPFEKSTRRPKPRARGPTTGSMTVAIIDYGSGNLHSAAKAFERAAREAGLACEVKVTSSPEDVLAAERVVLPGVGAFADCRRGLDAVPGMAAALIEAVRKRGAPFLGICVGAQLMATRGLEYEAVAGLDWIKGDVAPIKPRDATLKIPHMGRSEEHTSELQSPLNLVCRLLLEKKKHICIHRWSAAVRAATFALRNLLAFL